MDAHDRNLLARLRRCAVVGEYWRLLPLHSVPAHCSCCSDIPGDGPDLFDRRMGGKYSNPEAASPEALFATDTSCWTGFCRPEYRVSQYPLIPCAEPRPLYGRRENSKSAAPLQLFRSIDRL